MKEPSWTWVSARSTGTSHLRAGKGCDDFGACLEVYGASSSTLVAIASDGAGSARYSSIGSRITSRVFTECAVRFVRSGEHLKNLSADIAKDWLDDIRDRIMVAAVSQGAAPRDFAATLVGSLIGSDHAAFIHIGDGGSVFKAQDASEWTIATWPQHGEYAATTFFVTDDPEPKFQFVFVDQRIGELAIFSDGIERLVLDFSTHSAFAPFFERMFAPIHGPNLGRNRKLSRDLHRFLDGPSVCEKTDDDKTLILAKRISSS